jgi:O-Antigen ligase
MSARVSPIPATGSWAMPGWLLATLILIGTAVVGPVLGGLSRPIFVLGCGLVGWLSWRRGPASHLQAAMVLFTFAPLVRRVVDLHVGYDQLGLMLIGPMLAILMPVIYLPRLLEQRSVPPHWVWPLGIVAASVVYAGLLSMAQGDWTNAASGMLKWLAPLFYAAVLLVSADREEMVDAATSTFAVILPLLGIYSVYQYVAPLDWDVFWMQNAPIPSIGLPLPYEVRVFGTMNSPASFATFTAIGLFMIGFSKRPWLALLALPAALGLLLSLYRTAWLSLALSILFCLLFSGTRRRAVVIVVGIGIAVLLAVLFTPFGDVVADRLSTLSEGSKDGSAQERMEEFITLWNMPDSSLFGTGFTTTDAGSAGAMPIDGMLVACWLSMGIIVGALCLTALCWAIGNAVAVAFIDPTPEAIVIGALALGALLQLPLANITSGENGFFFWTFAVLLGPGLRSRPTTPDMSAHRGAMRRPTFRVNGVSR